MEVIKFVRDTYWSTDYLIEKDGKVMLAKFVPNYLIRDPNKLIIKARIVKTLDNVLAPREFIFSSDNETILIYDCGEYKCITDSEVAKIGMVTRQILQILCELLTLPRPLEPVVGIDDFAYYGGQIYFFVPMFDNYSKLNEALASSRDIFVSQAFLKSGSSSYSELADVFKMSLIEISKKIGVEIPDDVKSFLELQELPRDRVSLEYCLASSALDKYMLQDRRVSFAKIPRKELQLITEKLQTPSNLLLGVVGPQRIGKTTLIGELKVYLKEAQKFFFHPSSIEDFVVQFLQIYAERLSFELVQQLLECVETRCKLDKLKLLFLETINYLNEEIFVIVDDYQERDIEFKAFLISLFEHVKRLGSESPPIKIIAFSVEDYEEFSERIFLSPFSEEEIKHLLSLSLPHLRNEAVLAKWLHATTKGFPGLVVEMMKYLIENDVIKPEGDYCYFDATELENLSFEGFVDNKISSSFIKAQKYIALLGQKFTVDEVQKLKDVAGIEIDLKQLLEEGLIYKEYGALRFTLKQYWEALYKSIPEDERRKFHLELGKVESNFEKKAWHYEMGGFKTKAIVAYLNYVRHSIENYDSFATVAKILEHVKSELAGRVSYAFLSLSVRTSEIYSEISVVSDLKIPEKNLYKLLLARTYFTNGKFSTAYEILCSTVRYGNFGEFFKEYLKTFSLYRETSKRSVDRKKLEEIISVAKPRNKLWARLIGNLYYLLSLLTRDLREKAKLLKSAERLFTEGGVLERLPIVYNNLAITTYSVQTQIKYLEKAIEAAEKLGIPAKGLHAKLNLLLVKLNTGKIQDFLHELRRTIQKVRLLGLKDSLGFALSLEAFYHAYNNDKESALRAVDESIRENYHHAKIYKLVILSILRDFQTLKEEIAKYCNENTGFVEDYVELFEFLKSYGTEEFAKKALSFLDSDIYYFREEMLSIFGYELSLAIPGRIRQELEKLEKHFTLNQEIVPLAFVYEGYGNYYAALGYEYKAEMYYVKASKIFSEVGFYGALERMAKLYPTFSVNRELSVKEPENLITEMMMALKVLDPSVQLESFLNFFITKLSSYIPASDISVVVRDSILEETYFESTGSFEGLENSTEYEEKLELTPLNVVYKVNVDEYANLTLILKDRSLYFSEDYEKTLVRILFEVQTGMMLVLKEALGILRSFVDPLTKALNRYRFEEALEFYFSNAKKFSGSLCLIMCDIDNFKKINDTYGHLIGDEVLKAVTRTIRASVRKTDLVARFGGEEFVILLPDAKEKDGYIVANRMRERVSQIDRFPFTVTMSFGVAEFTPKVQTSVELLRLADVALYEAKKTGKNKVVIYQDGMTGGLNI